MLAGVKDFTLAGGKDFTNLAVSFFKELLGSSPRRVKSFSETRKSLPNPGVT
jgi:hypothetical protein